MEEGDLNGATHDRVDPEPPPGAEHGAGDAGAHDLPHQREVVVHGGGGGVVVVDGVVFFLSTPLSLSYLFVSAV